MSKRAPTEVEKLSNPDKVECKVRGCLVLHVDDGAIFGQTDAACQAVTDGMRQLFPITECDSMT